MQTVDSNTVFFFFCNKMKITNSGVSCMWLLVRGPGARMFWVLIDAMIELSTDRASGFC